MDAGKVRIFLMEFRKAKTEGGKVELKQFLKQAISKIRLAPVARQVNITYRLPEPIMITPLAGALFNVIHMIM